MNIDYYLLHVCKLHVKEQPGHQKRTKKITYIWIHKLKYFKYAPYKQILLWIKEKSLQTFQIQEFKNMTVLKKKKKSSYKMLKHFFGMVTTINQDKITLNNDVYIHSGKKHVMWSRFSWSSSRGGRAALCAGWWGTKRHSSDTPGHSHLVCYEL